jgi:hypothetical protein
MEATKRQLLNPAADGCLPWFGFLASVRPGKEGFGVFRCRCRNRGFLSFISNTATITPTASLITT